MPWDDVMGELGLTPLINVSGTETVFGASPVSPEVVRAIAGILPRSVEMAELQRAASHAIAASIGQVAAAVHAAIQAMDGEIECIRAEAAGLAIAAAKKLAHAALAAAPEVEIEEALRVALHQAIGEPRVVVTTAPVLARKIQERADEIAHQEGYEGRRRRIVRVGLEQDGLLIDRGVVRGRHDPARAAGHADDLRQGDKAQFGRAGVDELIGLSDRGPLHQLRSQGIIDSQLLHRLQKVLMSRACDEAKRCVLNSILLVLYARLTPECGRKVGSPAVRCARVFRRLRGEFPENLRVNGDVLAQAAKCLYRHA